ncbi:MAG: hypothetical protein EPN86_05030 [Nanoarchaeota archaeon]|nr:MAG: hypothetical protein EPN86_05030 [Nanoarchaeota archaeon]
MESLEEQLARYKGMPKIQRDFTENFDGVIDDRNRLVIPKEYREILQRITPESNTLALTLGYIDNAMGSIRVIFFLPELLYNQKSTQVEETGDIRLQYEFASNHYIRSWDEQGRILLPQQLILPTNVSKENDVKIIGCGNIFAAKGTRVDRIDVIGYVNDAKEV